METGALPKKRQLPKLMACMTKTSLDNLRNRALFSLAALDAKGIRRRKLPLHECLILELRESGFTESSDYLQDLIYDNIQLLAEDDIGIVIDLKKREDFLEHISAGLVRAEKQRDKQNTKKEALELLELAMYYAEKGKGILWLAEKFFHASIAVSSQFLLDGGRQKGCCKYHYAIFLLDKFPGADPEEPFLILTEVRDSAIGKDWLLYEGDEDEDVPPDTLFSVTALQLHRVLLSKARLCRDSDTAKSERLSRLAERRAHDANDTLKTAEAIVQIGISQLMMNNLNNAQKTINRAYAIYKEINNIEGLCETIMHLAAVMQRLGDHESAAKLLTEMGSLAMEHGLRRQLGRALHLLGELHLRRERPELGTQHLSEAFQCFMGLNWQYPSEIKSKKEAVKSGDLGVIYKMNDIEIYETEAEQSRLMMAISAGQELMASYFNLLREAGKCTVAKSKTIEWKLSNSGWWIKRLHHDFIPCVCPIHNRTPLDILWLKLESKSLKEDYSESGPLLDRIHTTENIQHLRSSIQYMSDISHDNTSLANLETVCEEKKIDLYETQEQYETSDAFKSEVERFIEISKYFSSPVRKTASYVCENRLVSYPNVYRIEYKRGGVTTQHIKFSNLTLEPVYIKLYKLLPDLEQFKFINLSQSRCKRIPPGLSYSLGLIYDDLNEKPSCNGKMIFVATRKTTTPCYQICEIDLHINAQKIRLVTI